jgi:CDP-paratose 2-epimerase
VENNRKGDHIWWISDLSHFQSLYPEWHLRYNVQQIMSEIYEDGYKRWAAA